MKLIILGIYWRITRTYLRLRGAKVGRNVRCNGIPYIKIRKGGHLILEDGVNINASRWANPHNMAGSTNFHVGANATLHLGQGVGISGSRLIAIEKIEIGAGTLIGAGCLICDSDMHEVPLGNPKGVKTAPIRIGERGFLGAGSIVLKGVEIGDGAVIGAGSVVTSSAPAHHLIAGNPALVIRPFYSSPDTGEPDPKKPSETK